MTLQIEINDQAVAFNPAEDSSVAQIIEALSRDHLSENQVLSTIVIDGHFWRKEWDAHLDQLDASTIKRLQVYSQSPDEAAETGRKEIVEAIDVIEANLNAAARAFRFGEMDKALASFLEGAGLLKDAMHFLTLYINHKDVEAQDERRVSLSRLDSELSEVVERFNEAQQSEDWSLVADLIEYEMLPKAIDLQRVAH
jgi:hypothetical protein